MNRDAVIGLAAVVAVIWAILPEAAPRRDPGSIFDEATAQVLVRSVLVDPDSARFSAIRQGRAASYCGRVNARNRFGGYTGPVRFVVGHPTMIAIDDDSSRFGEIWRQRCAA